MGEWKEYRLGDVANVQTGPFGSQLHSSDYVEIGIPSIMPTNIGSKLNIVRGNLVFITDDDAKRLNKYTVKSGDIVYSRRGDVEKCAYITDKENGWLCGTGCLRVRINDCKVADPLFCAYYLSTNEIKSYISSSAVGTTMPNLNTTILSGVPLLLPPLEKQKEIAETLSSIDAKIDLLNTQNATLESMAEALFRHHFIENAQSDWVDGVISDVADHYKVSVSPKKFSDTPFYHYSIPSFDNGKNPIVEMGVEIQSGKYRVPQNCLLFSKLNPHKDKRIWLMLDNIEDNAICSTEFQVVKPKNNYYLYFIYGWLSYIDNYNEIASGVGGTSGSHQRIDPATIFSFGCPIIEIDYISQYNQLVQPIFEKQRNNRVQIQTLTKMRDGLLPKLMSNEIKV